uniref:Uncharacterized protein n=2 Tax=Cryptomonas curvata TaxID=233186 RepID=A0A7S0MTK7_9CRYP|mmetsp:Transcript_51853/g.108341  ORF Transcript_51853/g.108341 Transcript_51853/m.108341 type:complete len:198 (+) Transcript_51853:149-742(+)
MKNICTTAIESKERFNPKDNTSARPYSFKKRKPLPGAYPKNFSPYLLTNISTTRAVPLSRSEIRNDLNFIQQAITKKFSSRYFEEVTCAPEIERQIDEPCQIDVPCQKASHQQTIHRRIPRKPNLSSFQVPTTEAEERRQLRAAMKESQLEAAQTNDFARPELRMLNENWNTAAKQEAVNGARLLRAVCSGRMFRTG